MTHSSISYAGPMAWRFLVLTSLLLACTKQNPKSCRDGVCNDPSLPYCDVGGELSGTPFTCVAGDCTAGTFAACRGDTAITCNAAGTSFDDVQCELGCDAASGGCRLCNPNETACTNGTLATCDAAGKVVSSEKCALGCFEDQPRCRDIDPSNGLSQFLDHVVDPPDLDLPTGDINTSTGVVRNGNGDPIAIPNFLVPAPAAGAAIRVFIVNHANIGAVQVITTTTQAPAVAIVAHSTIQVAGRLTVFSFAGEVAFAACMPSDGFFGTASTSTGQQQQIISGDGGGGNATAGGDGGAVNGCGDCPASEPGGKGAPISGTASLEPLRGGCPGGGAIQLVSRESIQVDGVIDANGTNGEPLGGPEGANAGGGGGSILLEAPAVILGPNAKLLAKGGAGSLGGPPSPIGDDALPAQGERCGVASPACGDAGNGAAPGVAASAGKLASYTNAPNALSFTAGGGGGGLGRVRINTGDGSYTKTNTTLEAAALTTGTLRTR